MSRLRRKLFLFFWLAQLTTLLGVGVTMWMLRPEMPLRPPPGVPREIQPWMAAPPPPPRLIPPLTPLVAGSVVSLVFAGILGRSFLRPIRSLRDAFEALIDGRLDTRIGGAIGKRGDELADLGRDFDRMAQRLQTLFETQRTLLHDISHELRSPTRPPAGDRRLDPAAATPRNASRGAHRSRHGTDRSSGGPDLDARSGRRRLHGATQRSCRPGRGGARGGGRRRLRSRVGLPLIVNVSDPLVVDGDRELLGRALENVVRNAIRHSPAGSPISIRTTGDASARLAHVTVCDRGPGVHPSELETILLRSSGVRRPTGRKATGWASRSRDA